MFGKRRMQRHIDYLKKNRIVDREAIRALEFRLNVARSQFNSRTFEEIELTLSGKTIKGVTHIHYDPPIQSVGRVNRVDENPISRYEIITTTSLLSMRAKCIIDENYEEADDITKELDRRDKFTNK